MTVKEKLRAAWTTNIEIEARKDRLKSIKLIDQSKTQRKLSADIKRLYQQINTITEIINSIDNPAMRAVLIKRYIQFQKWHEIAIDLHYSISAVHKLHSAAIKILSNQKSTHFSTTIKK